MSGSGTRSFSSHDPRELQSADKALAPGEAMTVASGPGATAGPGVLVWTTQNIWNNSGDPGRLVDQDGNVVAETGAKYKVEMP